MLKKCISLSAFEATNILFRFAYFFISNRVSNSCSYLFLECQNLENWKIREIKAAFRGSFYVKTLNTSISSPLFLFLHFLLFSVCIKDRRKDKYFYPICCKSFVSDFTLLFPKIFSQSLFFHLFQGSWRFVPNVLPWQFKDEHFLWIFLQHRFYVKSTLADLDGDIYIAPKGSGRGHSYHQICLWFSEKVGLILLIQILVHLSRN